MTDVPLLLSIKVHRRLAWRAHLEALLVADLISAALKCHLMDESRTERWQLIQNLMNHAWPPGLLSTRSTPCTQNYQCSIIAVRRHCTLLWVIYSNSIYLRVDRVWDTAGWSGRYDRLQHDQNERLFIALQILMQCMDACVCVLVHATHWGHFCWSTQPQRPVWGLKCGFIKYFLCSSACFFLISLQTITLNSLAQGGSLFVASDWPSTSWVLFRCVPAAAFTPVGSLSHWHDLPVFGTAGRSRRTGTEQARMTRALVVRQ